jgi:uncharacterized protein YbjT (DUF2867 family)
METTGLILLTGGTGYVGGRLIHPLEETGRPLRILARDPERLKPSNPPASFAPRVRPTTDVVRGDLLDPESLAQAMAGVDTAYYLVHSLGTEGGGFYERELSTARNFARAAQSAGVRRIIYLGGLGSSGDRLSNHLASRQDAGRALCESGAEVIEFRASVILGSGSISFEMIRGLVDRLPVMITPRWVDTLAQPVAIEDVVAYLLAALDAPVALRCTVYEIGGTDRVSYGGMMRAYARSQGLDRVVLRVPLLTPRLSAAWLALVTPLYYRIGRHLLEGARNETIVSSDAAARDFPEIRPMGVEAAIARALTNEDLAFATTRWSDARSTSPESRGHDPVAAGRSAGKTGHRYLEHRTLDLDCPPPQAFGAVLCIGGATGWYAWSWLWALRGLLDQLTGGVGLRRGRRDPVCAVPGDTIDFWRVQELEPDRRLLLTAEMRGPGRGWLQFDSLPLPEGGTRLVQTAMWDPIGLLGHLYWFSLWPAHRLIFDGMIRGIARQSGCAQRRPRRD